MTGLNKFGKIYQLPAETSSAIIMGKIFERISCLALCMLLLALLPAAVSGQLTPYGNIAVSSVPAGAAISLNGTSTGAVTPYTITGVPVGTNTVLLHLSGHQDNTSTVSVTSQGTATVAVSLIAVIPPPAISSISPASGYNSSSLNNVVISGTAFSTSATPSVVLTGSGFANITCSCAGSATQLSCTFPINSQPAGVRNVIVTNADGQAATLTSGFTVLNPTSSVTLTSITPSSGVANSTVSITSIAGTNFQTSATIRLRRSGYNDIVGTVSSLSSTSLAGSFNLTGQVPGDYLVCVVNPSTDPFCGLTFTINSDIAQPNGSILFDTNPSGASVYLNNTYRGTTTLTLYDVTPGYYRVMLQLGGYQTYTDTIHVTSGNRVQVYSRMISVAATQTTAAPTTVPTVAVTTARTTTKKPATTTATPWPSDTPTTASPLDPLLTATAAGLGILALRKL